MPNLKYAESKIANICEKIRKTKIHKFYQTSAAKPSSGGLLKPGTPYLSLSLSLCLSPTDALQVELRRIWAMQRPDLNRLTDLNNCPRETEP